MCKSKNSPSATPVIVRKNALADNVPAQDLHLTKAHALYVDDLLISVEFLVNHRTIFWDDRAQEVELYHVELDRHDVLFANGAAAESYRDDGNRWLFQNANEGWHLPPQEPYAPILTAGPKVDAAWARLLTRAGWRPSVPLTDDPDLHLLVDGVRLAPAACDGPHRTFFVPGKPACVAIASRDGVPAELGFVRDSRSLGVAIREIAVHRGDVGTVVKPSDPRLIDGFHDYEPVDDLRWTNGLAMLPAELLDVGGRGPLKLVLTLGAATRYPELEETVRVRAA